MIRDHVYRPPRHGAAHRRPLAEWPCVFMNCRRPRAEHERAAERGDLVQDGIAAVKAARS